MVWAWRGSIGRSVHNLQHLEASRETEICPASPSPAEVFSLHIPSRDKRFSQCLCRTVEIQSDPESGGGKSKEKQRRENRDAAQHNGPLASPEEEEKKV